LPANSKFYSTLIRLLNTYFSTQTKQAYYKCYMHVFLLDISKIYTSLKKKLDIYLYKHLLTKCPMLAVKLKTVERNEQSWT